MQVNVFFTSKLGHVRNLKSSRPFIVSPFIVPDELGVRAGLLKTVINSHTVPVSPKDLNRVVMEHAS